MRSQPHLVEFDIDEAAGILGISAEELKKGVEAGWLRYFYRNHTGYKFHDASLEENRRRLNAQKNNKPSTPAKTHQHSV